MVRSNMYLGLKGHFDKFLLGVHFSRKHAGLNRSTCIPIIICQGDRQLCKSWRAWDASAKFIKNYQPLYVYKALNTHTHAKVVYWCHVVTAICKYLEIKVTLHVQQ